MTIPRRRSAHPGVLFPAYAVLLISLAVWATLQPWADPLDSSQALPTVALTVAAPAAVIPLVATGVGSVLGDGSFNALVVLVALVEAAALRRAVTGSWR
ncbi:hypothetical protein ACFC1R_32285 [Kitasatospora sp. NPDC056138]|uniref:hypothetical protein n=1 Tax=Kitasatospora sp. NPDC056138 TaxID=3345724 RepID=UPI0035E0739F